MVSDSIILSSNALLMSLSRWIPHPAVEGQRPPPNKALQLTRLQRLPIDPWYNLALNSGASSHPASGPAAERQHVGRQEYGILDTLGNLGDFIGGIAVVATLIYLAIQVRQNTSALQTASRQAISSGYRDSNRLRLDPTAALAWAKGLSDFENLPFEERNFFALITNDEALFFQGTFALYESGQLEESTYSAYLAWFASIIATPGGVVWWETIARPLYAPGMVAAVDKRISNGDLHDIRELPHLRLDDSPAAQQGDEVGR
jgi:hypothetical protein